MTDDIVARLRVLAAEFPTFNGIMDSEWTNAADEIERLRKLSGDAGKLREERDEARREVCEWVSLATRPNEKTPQQVAESRGWYCFNTREVKND